MTDTGGYQTLGIDQLRVGLYITLDLHWMDHPFVTNTFKIKDEAQIRTIKGLGLKTVRYDPAKSDCAPLPPPERTAHPRPPPPISAAEQAAIAAKKARIERLQRHRGAVLRCEKQLLEATGTLKGINQNLFARPQESVRAATQLVAQMAASLLSESDVAIHAMNDKLAGEDVYYHALNVAILAMILAKEMGLPREAVNLVGLGAVFHDIGKSRIPDRILRKTTPLTAAERHFLAEHPGYGEEIGQSLKVPRSEAIILDLEEEPGLTIGKTFRPAQLPREVFEYLSPRRRITYYFDEAPEAGRRP